MVSLDDVLNHLNHGEKKAEIFNNIRDAFSIDPDDGKAYKSLHLIMNKLVKDGYVIYLLPEKDGIKVDDISLWVYEISYDGKSFIEKGGYEQKFKNEKIELKYKEWSTFALIFGGVAAGIYYTFELLKWACSFLCGC